jgi:hypothetical protein
MRLGDLDLKSSQAGKADQWKQTELQLIKEGWYSGTEVESYSEKIACSVKD